MFVLGAVIGFFAYFDGEGGALPLSVFFLITGLFLFLMIAATKKLTWTPADKLKESLISNFPIPNTREDILEFLTLASTQIEPVNAFSRFFVSNGRLKAKWNAIWNKKCKQVYTKAKIVMTSDVQGLAQIKRLLNEAKTKV